MTPLRLLDTACAILLAAGALGAGMVLRILRGAAARPPRAVAPVHGWLGAAGLAVLVVALARGLPPSAMGTAGFGAVAGVLLGLALALGLAIAWAARSGRRPGGGLAATHAGFAIAGLVVLWVLVSLG